MKKKFLISFLTLFILTCVVSFSDVHDYWAGGWVASTGQDTWVGTATDVQTIPGGYSFRCPGSGICYEINGPWLDIYEGIGSGGPAVDVYRQ